MLFRIGCVPILHIALVEAFFGQFLSNPGDPLYGEILRMTPNIEALILFPDSEFSNYEAQLLNGSLDSLRGTCYSSLGF